MSGSLRLTYFDVPQRPQVANFVLEYAGAQYEDNGISPTGDEWKAYKPKTPFGEVPVLEVDGVMIAQSFAINRYLATRFNLRGNSELEYARADMIVEACGDIFKKMYGFWFEKDEAKKKEKQDAFATDWLPNFIKYFDTLIDSNSSSDWIVSSGLTYADLALADVFGAAGPISRGAIEWRKHSPKLAALVDHVEMAPNIKKWIKTRPQSAIFKESLSLNYKVNFG